MTPIESITLLWEKCAELFFTETENCSDNLQALSSLWTNDHRVAIYIKDFSKVESKVESQFANCDSQQVLLFSTQWKDWFRRVSFLWNRCVDNPLFQQEVLGEMLFPAMKLKFELVTRIHELLEKKFESLLPKKELRDCEITLEDIKSEREEWLLVDNDDPSFSVDWLREACSSHFDVHSK